MYDENKTNNGGGSSIECDEFLNVDVQPLVQSSVELKNLKQSIMKPFHKHKSNFSLCPLAYAFGIGWNCFPA